MEAEISLVAKRISWILTAILFLGVVVGSYGVTPRQDNAPKSSSSPSPAVGRTEFISACSGCHGLDGRGGEHAPDIATKPDVQQKSDGELFAIVRDGIPSAGMPAFRALLDAARIKATVDYLRVLQGQHAAFPLPGDPMKGRALFSASAGCSGCHMVNGHGGFIGSDLSVYAGDHSAEEIREAIVHPENDPDPRSKVVAVVTRDGQQFAGVLRNEDNFSLQLQSLDGTFHSLEKSDLKSIEVGPGPVMPAAYGAKFSTAQINDLVSYLMRVAESNASGKPGRPDGRNEEDQ
ncbi:MAG: c-type cytochrome [Candidatus Acidiferrales bacterium]